MSKVLTVQKGGSESRSPEQGKSGCGRTHTSVTPALPQRAERSTQDSQKLVSQQVWRLHSRKVPTLEVVL